PPCAGRAPPLSYPPGAMRRRSGRRGRELLHMDPATRRAGICHRRRCDPRGIILRALTEAPLNLAHTLFRTAPRPPRAIALIERDRLELDYAGLAERTLALAGGLQTLGVSAGD